MRAYLNILEDVYRHGVRKHNRTGVDTIVLPPQFFRHDMGMGFPLLTTKRMAVKTMLTELEGFIGGITNKGWFKYNGCKIWNEWSNPMTRPDGVKAEDWEDLGPIYGYQWRRFNGQPEKPVNAPLPALHDYPADQLATIVNTLKTNPDDRRMVCSAWNPKQNATMALPPCHVLWNVHHINGVLHLHWHQRSCDMFLGVPFNIASYAMLLTLLCRETGLRPGYLSAVFMDCHVYENHIDAVEEQLYRSVKLLPTIKFKRWNGIFEWKASDTIIEGYDPHPPIKGEVAV